MALIKSSVNRVVDVSSEDGFVDERPRAVLNPRQVFRNSDNQIIQAVALVDNAGNHIYEDFYFRVGENNIPGLQFIHKFGRNSDIDDATFETIWNGGGDYTGMNATAGEAIECFSGSANDAGTVLSSGTATGGSATTLEDTTATFISDGVAAGDMVLNDTDVSHGSILSLTETILTVWRFDKSGTFASRTKEGDSYRIVTAASTGLAVVELEFLLDSGYDNETSEFVVLNGTSQVDTVGTNYIRMSRLTGILVGSNVSNVGVVTARQTTSTGNVFAVMPIGYNQTMIAGYTIPKGKEGHLLSWKVALSGKKAAFVGARLMIRHRGEPWRINEETEAGSPGSSVNDRHYIVPKNHLPEGSDIKLMANSDQANTGVSGAFDIIVSLR